MKTFITLCAAALISSAATAGDPSRNPGDAKDAPAATFESLDRNKDQQLSKAEAGKDKALAAEFSLADVNADGFISRSEYVARTSPKPDSSQPYQPPAPDQ